MSTPFAPVSFGGKRRADKEKEKTSTSQPASQGQSSQPQPKRARFSLERPAIVSLPPSHNAQDSGPLIGRADGPGIVLPALKISNKLAVQVNVCKAAAYSQFY